MLIRKKYIQALAELIEKTQKKHIQIYGDIHFDKVGFLTSLEKEYNNSLSVTLEELFKIENENIIEYSLIIIKETIQDYLYFRTFIDGLSFEGKIIFTRNDDIITDDGEVFMLPGISFKEFSEIRGYPVDIGSLFEGKVDIEKLNSLKEEYIHIGQFPSHIEDPSKIKSTFEEKLADIYIGLFEKEKQAFIEYLQTLAMSLGDLYKADKFAKLLGLSRRKIHKYTDLLITHKVIQIISPWGNKSETETSRHTKVYFTDLSYLKAILGELHNQGQLKQGVIENFIYLELSRKLDTSHAIGFYRKKSGAEIAFILENINNKMLTPIEVTLRSTSIPSQAMKTFNTSYHEQVEYYMLINDSEAVRKVFNEKTLIVIPHIAI